MKDEIANFTQRSIAETAVKRLQKHLPHRGFKITNKKDKFVIMMVSSDGVQLGLIRKRTLRQAA